MPKVIAPSKHAAPCYTTPHPSPQRVTRKYVTERNIPVPDLFFDLNKSPVLNRKAPSDLEKLERRLNALNALHEQAMEELKEQNAKVIKDLQEEHEVAQQASRSHINERIQRLTCPICRELLWVPCVQPCGHAACYSCMKTLAKKSTAKWGYSTSVVTMECPECGHWYMDDPLFSYAIRDAVELLAVEIRETKPVDCPKMIWPPVFTREELDQIHNQL